MSALTVAQHKFLGTSFEHNMQCSVHVKTFNIREKDFTQFIALDDNIMCMLFCLVLPSRAYNELLGMSNMNQKQK